MIEFVYGAKGSGKTKKMIEMANAEVDKAKGDILFINHRDKFDSLILTILTSKAKKSFTDLSVVSLQATMMWM